MINTAIGFNTGHIGLNVTDLARSVDFYTDIFGLAVAGRSEEPGRRYAFLAQGQDLLLTLWEQSDGSFAADRPGLHHLSFRVESIDDVTAVQARAESSGARVLHGGIVPHGEGQSSGGLFFEDPDGIRLEVFAASGADRAPAPTPGAPTCGFF